MEHESIKDPNEDIEDGEISDSDDGYTLLKRPDGQGIINHDIASASNVKMEDASELDESLAEQSTDSSESETGVRSKSKKIRIKPNHQQQKSFPSQFKKYNIWSNGLQEESLLENLKVCGVDKPNNDRDIESYNYSLKYRLNGENSMKRRQSNNSDDSEDRNVYPFVGQNKRFRASSMGSGLGGRDGKKIRKNVRHRLGHKSEDSSSNDGFMNSPRLILDLNNYESSTDEDIARDIANKLYEEKDTLLLRVVEILGRDLPIKIFNETQKIEKDGGMMIMNGQRRRTPGGVFLFLLKHSNDIDKHQKKMIFVEETRKSNYEKKCLQNMKRDRKVEELKKSLKNENELTVLSTRSELHLKAEIHANLSNPPPSPVTDYYRENSSDFDSHDIHHLNVTSPEKMSVTKPTNQNLVATPATSNAYEDDILDMTCDDMDLF